VVVGPFVLDLDQVVTSEEKLGDITAVVVHQVELAPGVLSLVAVQIEHEVVEDHQLFALFDLSVYLSCCEYLYFPALSNFGRLQVAKRILVAKSVDCLEEDHEEAEGDHADRA
jgi:hypothetical protein